MGVRSDRAALSSAFEYSSLKRKRFMKTIEIKCSPRENFGKKESKRLRREGLVPCVIYGGGENVHFYVEESELKPLIYTPNSYIVNLQIGDKTEQGVMREVQFHPIKESALHIDFSRVVPGKPLSIDIPVKLTGVSAGVKMGGKMILSKRKLRVSALAEHLPDTLDVDVTNLELGKSIFVGDLKFDNLAILTPATTAVCAVRMTRAARGAAAGAAAAEK